ncbi:MAG: hypothetical protein J2P17_11720 [Mycobacterium sp.]|nr:hypothetical protein [Mycobacterium sp.]
MFDITEIGLLAGLAANPWDPLYYADQNGMVPEKGDKPDTFSYPSDHPYHNDSTEWTAWVAAAEAARTAAEAHEARAIEQQKALLTKYD